MNKFAVFFMIIDYITNWMTNILFFKIIDASPYKVPTTRILVFYSNALFQHLKSQLLLLIHAHFLQFFQLTPST